MGDQNWRGFCSGENVKAMNPDAELLERRRRHQWDPREMAFHAGFDGQRAERTWKQRLNILAELYFINLQEGPSGPASYALILNPYKVIKWHYDEKRPGLRKDKYHALIECAIEIGDESMSPPAPPPAVAPPTEVPVPPPMPANWLQFPTIPAGGALTPVQSVAPVASIFPSKDLPVK
jgi:hypothetical protein